MDDSSFTANAIADWVFDEVGGDANNNAFDGFSTTVSSIASDTDSDDEYVSLSISNPTNIDGTGAMNYAYTNDGGDDITAVAGGTLGNVGVTTATDKAGSVLIAAIFSDAATGTIFGDDIGDSIDFVFSEDISANSTTSYTTDYDSDNLEAIFDMDGSANTGADTATNFRPEASANGGEYAGISIIGNTMTISISALTGDGGLSNPTTIDTANSDDPVNIIGANVGTYIQDAAGNSAKTNVSDVELD